MISMHTKQNYSLEISKVFSVRVEKMFKAWTDLYQVAKWFGPEGYSTTVEKMDLKENGGYKFIMNPPEDGAEPHVLVGEYKEIVPNEKLVFTWKWEDAENEFPETLVTVHFLDQGENTEVKITHEKLPSKESAEGHHQGWNSTLEGSLITYFAL